jgi:hypothetical protein
MLKLPYLTNFEAIMHLAVSRKRVTGTKNSIQEFRNPELIVKYLIGKNVLITALMTKSENVLFRENEFLYYNYGLEVSNSMADIPAG